MILLWQNLADYFVGAVAIAASEDAVAAAKVVMDFAKQTTKIEIVAGSLDGEFWMFRLLRPWSNYHHWTNCVQNLLVFAGTIVQNRSLQSKSLLHAWLVFVLCMVPRILGIIYSYRVLIRYIDLEINMSDKLEKIVEELSKLSVIEAADLSKMLEEKWEFLPLPLLLLLLDLLLVPLLKKKRQSLM